MEIIAQLCDKFASMMWLGWVFFGVLLCLSEIFLLSFFVLFVGISAIITGILVLIFPGISLVWQIVIFGALSLVMLLIFCNKLKGSFVKNKVNSDGDDFSNAVGIAEEDIMPGAAGGRVSFEGSSWPARTDVEIAAGEEVRVLRRENITLIVTKL